MALAFSSNDEATIKRTVSVKQIDDSHPKYDPQTTYELKRCIHWIQENKFKRVALQFPDERLVDSHFVASKLQVCTDSKIFILADTSYGSCCVDEVAAEHVSADAIIHYGHSCLSPTNRLPVLYVFCSKPIDAVQAGKEFQKLITDVNTHVIIFYDTCYDSEIDAFMEQLKSENKNIIWTKLVLPRPQNEEAKETAFCEKISVKPSENIIVRCSRSFELPENVHLESCEMFFIGSEGALLNNLMMTFNNHKFYSYDPVSLKGRVESVNVNQALRRRYYLIELAKDAQIVGILIGTLGVTNYLTIIKHLKQLIAKAHKKSYTIAVGKPSVSKLANFPEIEIFVLVACSENSFVDAKEFYQKIITPFELEIALNPARQWTGSYITSFSDLLPGGDHYVARNDNEELESNVSLISGKLRLLGMCNEEQNSEATVSVRNEKTALSTLHSQAAGEYLSNRSWRGLEQKLGETPVSKASKGDVGIASGYEDEGKQFETN